MSSEIPPLQPDDPRQVGAYRLLSRLGAGGMGRVYLGRSPGGRTVAVKVIHPDLAEDPQFRRRFAHEVAAARRVGGIYTVQVVDADSDDDPPWLVTEYIAGPTLQNAVDDHGALTERSVAALGAGLAEGLRAIHGESVIHRDLKPGNVLLAADGPRIIDFGIARAMDATSMTTRTALVGTPGYMSPEQYRGQEIGTASDVFCLASVLVFAATGRRPFGDGPAEALGYRVVAEAPDLTGVPASLLPLISAGLEKDPDARPDVTEFLDRCSGLAGHQGLSLPEPVTSMINTRVLETEALIGPAEAADKPPMPAGAAPAKPAPTAPPPQAPWGKTSSSGSLMVVAAVGAILLAFAGFGLFAYKTHYASSNSANGPVSSVTPPAPVTSNGGYTPPTSTPTIDRTAEAFKAISVGDCLDAYGDPTVSTWTWTKNLPNAVDCNGSDAYMRVTGVKDSVSDCGHRFGQWYWYYSDEYGATTVLCLDREIHDGACLLGTKEADGIHLTGRGLMSSWGCNRTTVPREFDYILKITAWTTGACPARSYSWNVLGARLCAEVI